MLSVYGRVFPLAARRAARSWPVIFSLVVYAILISLAGQLARPLGIVGGFLMGFVLAACWSSYLDLISQAVTGSKIRIKWDDFKRTFGSHFWDVISVMFALWLISFLMRPLLMTPQGDAVEAVLGLAMFFFLNAVPELLYQGQNRSFALLLESGSFMLANPVVWLLPNVLFMAIALAPTGALQVDRPAELLVVFSSPGIVLARFAQLPIWTWPLLLVGIHFVMVFRGILFTELSSGVGRARRFPPR